MNSFLLIQRQKETHEMLASEICLKKGIGKLDITIINTQEPLTSEESTSQKIKGIALIRSIIRTISLKPIQGEKKAVIILHAETLSIPAQNALLKTLEEPPPHTIIILTSENKYLLLPTILSRCQILEEEYVQGISSYKEDNIALPTTKTISSALAFAEGLSKDKTKAVQFLESHIVELHGQLQECVEAPDNLSSAFKLRKSLSSHLETYKHIKSTNINLRFALERLFLSSFFSH